MKKEPWIETTLSGMSLEQKIGQCVVVGMSGTVITNDLREAITRYHCSGVRLSPFTRMFSYFSDEKAKKQELDAGFVPSMQKIATGGLPPSTTPEQYAEMLNELRQVPRRSRCTWSSTRKATRAVISPAVESSSTPPTWAWRPARVLKRPTRLPAASPNR
jgi:hypothetical protein